MNACYFVGSKRIQRTKRHFWIKSSKTKYNIDTVAWVTGVTLCLQCRKKRFNIQDLQREVQFGICTVALYTYPYMLLCMCVDVTPAVHMQPYVWYTDPIFTYCWCWTQFLFEVWPVPTINITAT